tara:strand:+ start:593 stop:913 length:321 start_codon:yes stop_codon:yes gene_type:complete
MSLMSFEAAARLWLDLADAVDPEVDASDDAYQCAERLILEHRPRADHEAVLVAEVLAESIAGGERSDGRDVLAARNLQLWVGRSLTGEVVPTAARTLARVAARAVA